MIVRSRAPVRISFGGGGTDLSPYCDKYGGAVISATINKYVYATLIPKSSPDIRIISADYKRTILFDKINDVKFTGDVDLIKAVILRIKPDFGFDLFLRSDIPPNTGLGSSAAVTTAVIGVFNHMRGSNKLNRYQIAELAYQIEKDDLKNAGGRQDQYASSFGGFNLFEFSNNDNVRVIPIDIPQGHFLELEKHLVLAYMGPRGPSGEIQQIMLNQQISSTNRSAESHAKTQIFHGLKKFCHEMHIALISGQLDKFGSLLDKAWHLKQTLSPAISNSQIENIYQQSKKVGTIGGKITGAGGGGCMIFFCKSNTEHLVTQSLQRQGAQIIDFTFDHDGLVTWQLEKKHRHDSVHRKNEQVTATANIHDSSKR